MKCFKFDCCVGEALPAKFVQMANEKFHVLNEADWPIMSRQIESSKEIVIDSSYIAKANFIDQPTIYSGIYTEISFPLFNKTKDVCILRVSTLGFCASDEIRIYKKREGRWELYKFL